MLHLLSCWRYSSLLPSLTGHILVAVLQSRLFNSRVMVWAPVGGWVRGTLWAHRYKLRYQRRKERKRVGAGVCGGWGLGGGRHKSFCGWKFTTLTPFSPRFTPITRNQLDNWATALSSMFDCVFVSVYVCVRVSVSPGCLVTELTF